MSFPLRWIACVCFLALLTGSGCGRKQNQGALTEGSVAGQGAVAESRPVRAPNAGSVLQDASLPQPKGERAGPSASQGLLWRVDAPKGQAYLLGSVHVGTEDLYPLRERINQAFGASKALVVEVDTKDEMAVAMQMMKAGTYSRGGESLESHISVTTWKKLEQAAAKAGLPMMLLSRMKPWMAAVSLTAHELQALGYKPEYGIDAHFMKLARERNLPLLSLETVEEQIDALSGLSLETQELMLRETVEESGSIRTLMADTLAAWRRGDAGGVEKLITATLAKPEYASVYEALFTVRNKRMAKGIQELLAEGGTYFVVVGAGHLIGAGSVNELLAAQGMKIERL